MTQVRVKAVVSNPVEKADGSPLPFLGLEDLESWTGKLLTSELPTKEAEDSVLHRRGDVLFSKLRPYLAKSYLPNTSGSATGELLVLRPGSMVDHRFLFYVTLSQSWIEWANTTAYGTKMPRTSWELISEYRMWLPDLEEQRRIADFLDTETAHIDKIVKLQEEIVSRLDERDLTLLDLEIDQLVIRNGALPFRRYIMGVDQGSSPQCEAIPARKGEWGVLKVSCLRPGEFFQKENKHLPNNLLPDVRHEVHEGDLLITRANTPQLVGSTAVVPPGVERLLLSDKIFRVKLTPRANARFVATVARGSRIRALCAASSNGASQSMANIRFEEIKEWPIPTADLNTQLELVKRVDKTWQTANVLRSKIQQQLALLAERRRALVTAAVTGQIDVSTASGRGLR